MKRFIWDGQDWYDAATKIGVKKGVPYSDDEITQRRITSAIAADGEIDNWEDKANVERVQDIIDEDDWERLFPMADDVYTYESFLRAVAKFPAFCGESNLTNLSED